MQAETFGHDWLGMDLPFACEIHQCHPQPTKNVEAKKVLSLFTEPKRSVVADSWLRENHKLFDLIVTYDRRLKDLPNVRTLEFGNSWCEEVPMAKEFSVSFLLSTGCNQPGYEGYDVRKHIALNIQKAEAPIRLFLSTRSLFVTQEQFDTLVKRGEEPGFTVQPLSESKAPMFRSMFHICVENSNDEYYFTEKIVDCFRTYTVPIYWGTRKVAEFFDENGIIFLDRGEDINSVVSRLTPDDYWKRLGSLHKNRQLSDNFLLPTQRLKALILKELAA